MLTIDFIGLLITAVVVGLRYPHYVLLACFLHEAGLVVAALFLNGHIASMVTAGAFGTVEMSNLAGLKASLVLMGAPLANYIASLAAGGIAYEPSDHLFNPLTRLNHPFAVTNMRLAFVSALYYIGQIFW